MRMSVEGRFKVLEMQSSKSKKFKKFKECKVQVCDCFWGFLQVFAFKKEILEMVPIGQTFVFAQIKLFGILNFLRDSRPIDEPLSR